nr:putative ribonuclease H-like domain-containing protein [Tanacetum cinerariifolium]
MCDKKNNVLFTDTECLVLSSNIKLRDESQVLLRVLRKDNIYNVDLKSVVPTGVVVGFQTNSITGTKDNNVAGQAEKKKEPEQEYILIPIRITDPLISQGPKDGAVDAGKKATERIFRYLKGQRKLGLWYPKDSPFDLEAYSDSNYVRASLDKKSIIGGCQFLGKRLISWQCKKQTIVANSTTKVEYVAAASCCEQVTKISQSSRLTNLVANETVYKEWEERMERATTIASSLEAKQNSGKPSESEGFEQIIDFLNAKPIRHALTMNPTVYTSSIMASAIICLANNLKFNFSKYIFDNIVKHSKGGVKVLMFPRFLQVFLDKQVKGMVKHKEIYVISSHTKKIFANIRRQRQGFSRNVTPLFKTMMVTAQEEVGEGSGKPSESEGFEQIIDFLNAKPIRHALTMNPTVYTSSIMASAIICLANNLKFNFSKYIFDNIVKHSKGGVKVLMFPRFLQVFLDKQVKGMVKHKEIYVISSHTKKIFANIRRQRQGFSRNVTPLFKTMMVTAQEEKKIKPKRKQRQAAEVHSPSSEIPIEESVLTASNDSLPSGKDSIQLNELMIFCTNLQQHVLDSEEAKIAQVKKIAKLKKRVRKLEKRRKSRPAGLKRLKKGKSIKDIDQDVEIAIVDESQGRMHDADMFKVDDLIGNEVIIKKEVSTANPITTDGEVVTAASVALTTITTANVHDELTLVKTLIAIKAAKPKVISTAITTPRAKDIIFHEQVQAHIPTVSSSNDKEVARKLEAEMRAKMEEEERIAREKDKANRAMRVNTFVDMDTENVEEILKKTQAEGRTKRVGQELEQESAKKQKLAEPKKDKVADDNTAKLKRCLVIVPEDDDDVAIEATPLYSRSPTIVDYKIYKEGKKSYFKIIRADGNSQNYLTFKTMFKNFNREELEVLRSIIKEWFKKMTCRIYYSKP